MKSGGEDVAAVVVGGDAVAAGGDVVVGGGVLATYIPAAKEGVLDRDGNGVHEAVDDKLPPPIPTPIPFPMTF